VTPDLENAPPIVRLKRKKSKRWRGARGRLPVVRRDNPQKIVGYLGRASIMTARLRRHEEEHHREAGWLQAFSQ